MSDPATEILVQAASNAIGEVIKSVLSGLGLAKDWFRATTSEHDPFGIVARRYAERMQERYGSIRIFGMSAPVPLRDIYVRVHVLPKITARHRATVDDMERVFDRDARTFGSPVMSVDGIELLEREATVKVFVLGRPGAGKTTFLKSIALQALERKFRDERIPLFISLKDWNDSNLTLTGFAIAEFESCGLAEAGSFVTRLLDTGGFVVLLDGVDEMTGDVELSTRQLRQFIDRYPNNIFVISCRIAAYNYVFEQFTDVEMADFTPAQIEQFAKQWFRSAPAKGRLFLDKLGEKKNRAIAELASTPLLLTMLCLAFEDLLEFPPNRAELYGEAIDALLKKWDSSRSIRREQTYKNLSVRHKQDLLSAIARETFPAGRYFVAQRNIEDMIGRYIANLPSADVETLDIDSEAVLKAIEAQHGLLVERAQRIYSFSHLTFQEFFMARALSRAGQEEVAKAVAAYLFDAKWREVFLLLSEMVPSADYLLRRMRDILTMTASDARLDPILREIDKVVIAPGGDERVPRVVARVMALALIDSAPSNGFGEAVLEPARMLLSEFGYVLPSPIDMERRIIKIYEETLDTAAANKLAGSAATQCDPAIVHQYIQGTRVLLACLQSQAYLTASVRDGLWNRLCLE